MSCKGCASYKQSTPYTNGKKEIQVGGKTHVKLDWCSQKQSQLYFSSYVYQVLVLHEKEKKNRRPTNILVLATDKLEDTSIPSRPLRLPPSSSTSAMAEQALTTSGQALGGYFNYVHLIDYYFPTWIKPPSLSMKNIRYKNIGCYISN
jgi:hypothetical protein